MSIDKSERCPSCRRCPLACLGGPDFSTDSYCNHCDAYFDWAETNYYHIKEGMQCNTLTSPKSNTSSVYITA